MSRSSAGRPERGARFTIIRVPTIALSDGTEGFTFEWSRHSNGRVLARGDAVDLRQVLDQIERVTGGVVVNEVRGPRRRLERAVVEQRAPRGALMLTRLEVLW